MPFHDLNLPVQPDAATLSYTLAFLAELEYGTAAISLLIDGKIPAIIPEVNLEKVYKPTNLRLLTRLTLTVSDPSQNHRLAQLQSHYDLVALRPTNDKALQLCCSSLECDLISVDFAQRLGFIFKFKTVAAALQRGVRFEICYSPGVTGGNDARRNLISGATALIRATRGRGIILSSEARNALGLRAPWDVINLAQIWGLNQERGKEAVCEEARKVVQLAKLKRESFRGVIHVIDGGEKALKEQTIKGTARDKDFETTNGIKRKASQISGNGINTQNDTSEQSLSRREMKRRAKKAKAEGTTNEPSENASKLINQFPIQHEILAQKKKS